MKTNETENSLSTPYLGQEGHFQTSWLTLVRKSQIQWAVKETGEFDWSYLYRFVDRDLKHVLCFTKADLPYEKKSLYLVHFEISKHQVYRGEHQTIVKELNLIQTQENLNLYPRRK